MRRARELWVIVYLIPLAFLGVFYVYPLLSIFDVSLRPAGILDLSAFVRLLSSDYYIGTLLFTVYQAALSTAVTLLLATPCAFVFARYRFRGKTLLLSLATLPFVLPTVVVALAFATLLGGERLAQRYAQDAVFTGIRADPTRAYVGDDHHRARLLQFCGGAAHHNGLLVVGWFQRRRGRSLPWGG